jgi:hypothetical protein
MRLLPLVFLAATVGTSATAGEFPKRGEAELFVFGTIRELAIIDSGALGSIGQGDYSGVIRNAAGTGPFHDLSDRCTENWTLIEGKRRLSGACVWTDQDGDHVLSTFGEGQNNLVNGTGKYAGITGPYKFLGSTRLHEAPGRVIPIITHIAVTWEIK